jgi:hypothetical protein
MSEWWTYRLSDLLLFSPRTYYRLFELYNAGIWPAQLFAVLAGIAILALAWRGTGTALRITAAVLAAGWFWVGYVFLFQHYATINWAAAYAAISFVAQGLGLMALAVLWRAPDCADRLRWGAGWALMLYGIVAQPLVGPLLGRALRQIELFGLAPDATAVATLGFALIVGGRAAGFLMVLPVLWCLITGATLWAMGAADAWIAPLAAVFALLAYSAGCWRAAASRSSSWETASAERVKRASRS